MAIGSGTPGPGRPKGSKNLKTLLSACSILVLDGRQPVRELIAIADDPKATLGIRKEIWMFLQTYIEAPQDEPAKRTTEAPQESVEAAANTMALLAKLSSPDDPAPNA
jgi:hypothetical protein